MKVKKFTVLLMSAALPLVLAGCSRDCETFMGRLFGCDNPTTGGGVNGGGGGTQGAGGGVNGGGGGTQGVGGGVNGGGGGTQGVGGGVNGGGGTTNAITTGSAAGSATKTSTAGSAAKAGVAASAVVCTTHCNSNDPKCYNIAQCEADKKATASSAAASKAKRDKN